MSPIATLRWTEFNNLISAYLEKSVANDQAESFESAIESEAYERLVQDWDNAWDFHCEFGFFGGRGTSILIQNIAIDWQGFWEWLNKRAAAIPNGALINFEVYDSVTGDNMVIGPQLLRRVITADGVFEQGSLEDEQSTKAKLD